MAFIAFRVLLVARRKTLELPSGVTPFNRTAEQWRELDAPAWVSDSMAAAEAYVSWASQGYGRGADPTDMVIRLYYVEMLWLKHCVRPQWLAQAGALLDFEVQLLSTDRYQRWGRPGHCRSPMLDPEAPVPDWLACCRREARRGA